MQWLIVFIKESARFDPSAIVIPCYILTVGTCKLIQLTCMSAWWTIKYNLLNLFYSILFMCFLFRHVSFCIQRRVTAGCALLVNVVLCKSPSSLFLPYRCSQDFSSCDFWSQAHPPTPNKVQQACIEHATPDLFLFLHMLWFALT